MPCMPSMSSVGGITFCTLAGCLLCALQGMFNDDAFGKMKKGARIVNVARGGVIDEAALARALDNGQVAQVMPVCTPLCPQGECDVM